MVSYIHTNKENDYIYFYDKYIKVWIVTLYNKYGFPIQESDYFNNKNELKGKYPKFRFIKEGI